ncbi:hypothetical protein LTR64_002775 [Lithohypha guttulata]|uniref:uncharacterized protein n=1 Tax=Lithohypha guttulata TaxID=1690604 RepID=UPI002DDFDE4B|nr:hypothetical protein LTR51_001000 [Lithohypha guttulata]
MPRRKAALPPTNRQGAATRRSTRRAETENGAVPEIFNEMLIEAYHNNPEDFKPDPRPPKRRKIEVEDELPTSRNEHDSAQNTLPPPVVHPLTESADTTVPAPIQSVFDDDYRDSDSDADFEDVEILENVETDTENEEPKALQIDLSSSVATPKRLVQRRKPVTKAEREFRLNVHKWHLLCLLLHLATRNKWCEDEVVQKTLKSLIPRKLISRLHLEGTQAERKYAFDAAIGEICNIWRTTWKVNARGMRRAYWREHLDIEKEMEEAEDPYDLDDYRHVAKQRSGSRDIGAQIFCALLRSVAVETRLICSLQVLPFSRVVKGETPQKDEPNYIQAGNQNFGTARATSKRKAINESPYPVWWVEVLNPAIDQWIPLDPLVRHTINKPRTGFEPPAADSLNNMSYVIAFEDDGRAKDVTKRYTAAYNAKTIKSRVESTKNGQEWFSKVMHVFQKWPESRDDIEDAALDRRVAQEGMPKNVQDFKNHPVYVLERHLRANEVIEPRRECDGWYRKGRDIKAGEQPLKRVPKRCGTSVPPDDAEQEEEGVALYAEFQTQLYVPPPIVDGRVPKNGFGNLDIYVSTMIPAGGVHIRHRLAAQAAKTLNIDAVAAVIGFTFKGRQGTAIVDGVVVDERYTAAMIATIIATEDELEEEVNAQRQAITADVWKKMYAVLRMRQRLEEEYGGFGKKADDSDDDSTYEESAEGGFLPDTAGGEPTEASKAQERAVFNSLKARQPIVLPDSIVRQQVVVVRSPHKHQAPKEELMDELFGTESEVEGDVLDNDLEPDHSKAKGFPAEVEYAAGGFIPDTNEGGGFVFEDESDQNPTVEETSGGGFVTEEEVVDGGFIRDEDDPEEHPHIKISVQAPEEQSDVQPEESTISIDDLSMSVPLPQKQTHLVTPTHGLQPMQQPDDPHVDESDAGSLLSHDPDEEAADMQWVEDAFED